MTESKSSQSLNAWLDSWSKNIVEELGPRANDRTMAIVGAALLDTHLELLIANFLVDEKSEVNELLESEKPLGSFGARIRAAYCLGLISKNEYHDLKIIKGIRNAFAHELGISFTDQSIGDQCNNLKLRDQSLPSSEPRPIFLNTAITLGGHLAFRIEKVEQDRRIVPSEI